MDKIIVGFSTGKTMLSSLIRLVEGTPYSHVYIRFYSATYDRWMYYHAANALVHFLPEAAFKDHNIVIEEYEIEIPPEVKKAVVQYAIDHAGIKYGLMQLFGMAFVRLMYLWFNKKFKNPLADGTKTEVCSELLYDLAKHCLGSYPTKGDPEFDGPKWINKWVSQYGKRI